MNLRQGTSDDTRKVIFVELEALPLKDLGILEMVHGSFAPTPTGPAGLNRDFIDGLVVTFGSLGDRNNYNDGPDHQRILQGDIVPNLEAGINGLLRFDFVEAAAAAEPN
jgi:hypothetical protein